MQAHKYMLEYFKQSPVDACSSQCAKRYSLQQPTTEEQKAPIYNVNSHPPHNPQTTDPHTFRQLRYVAVLAVACVCVLPLLLS
jgi:hypothetical protein